jgi:hypothetical protein
MKDQLPDSYEQLVGNGGNGFVAPQMQSATANQQVSP